jgi:hypothetical protein
MTYEEAKHRIIRVLPDDFLKNEENREALSLMGIALEKQIPKKPKTLNYGLLIEYGWKYECPNCRCAVGDNKNLAFAYGEYLEPYEDYCCSCGQALDWSDAK